MEEKFYLKYGSACDVPEKGQRALYRLLETIPGLLSWATLLGILVVSRFAPLFASFFIIAFDVYWLIKTVFLSVHLRASYRHMRRNTKEDWLKKLQELPRDSYRVPSASWSDIHHLVILPFYNEPIEIVREGVLAISKSDYPKNRMIIVLAVEERAGEAVRVQAEKLVEEFKGAFFKILISLHPGAIEGELPGKGSNETWATRTAKEKIIDALSIPYERVIISSFDIDTKVLPGYFSCLTYNFLTAEKPFRSSYQPVPVYNNNIWQTPAFSRVVATSGTFWQLMQQSRPERLTTFSSHSMSFKTLVEMNYWHVNIVSEDSRIYWQALLHFDGDYRVIPLLYPISLDANVAPSLVQTAKNVYKQQRRWGWGVENVPYVFFGFIHNKNISLQKKIFYLFNQFEGFWSWGTNSFILFLLGWLPPLVGGHEFGSSVLAYNLPLITRFLMTLAMLGLVTSAIISTSLLPERPSGHPVRKYLWMVLQWALVPVTIIIFGSIPGLEAQTRLLFGKYMGFWVTPKFRGNSEANRAEIARVKR
ncbi:MAG: glycosyltransferase family 2 protein [Candidatus Sungbacteria bacterium]|nr:glycosyltransferase family 2 protein [Candidatus Sungbacteria bacterium]